MSQKPLPPLNWLRTFAVAVKYLNFTQASQELCLTQGTVSQQIRLLEDHLGAVLFKRLPRGLSLTEEGQSYYPVVQDAILRLTVGTDEIFNQSGNAPLKIRGSLSFFTYWLAPRLESFKLLHPQIDISYVSNIWLQELAEEDDMEIRWGSGIWPGLISQRLTWDTLFPVCSPALFAQGALERHADVAHYPLLHVLGYEEGWGYWLKKVGADEVDFTAGMQFDSLVSTLRMAQLGQGIALARSSLVADMLQQGQLVAPFAYRVPASESFYLVSRAGDEMRPQAAVFSQWLVSQVLSSIG